MLQKWHRMNLHFHSDQRENQVFRVCNKWAGNMLMFHVDVNMKRLGICFKNDSFQWFRVDSFFWETITLYTFRFKTLQDVFIHLELCYTLHERSFSKIHNRGTLMFIFIPLFTIVHCKFMLVHKMLKILFKNAKKQNKKNSLHYRSGSQTCPGGPPALHILYVSLIRHPI